MIDFYITHKKHQSDFKFHLRNLVHAKKTLTNLENDFFITKRIKSVFNIDQLAWHVHRCNIQIDQFWIRLDPSPNHSTAFRDEFFRPLCSFGSRRRPQLHGVSVIYNAHYDRSHCRRENRDCNLVELLK